MREPTISIEVPSSASNNPTELPSKPKKRFVGRSATSSSTSSSAPKSLALASHLASTLPTDPLLLLAISHLLPSNYNFEIPKTIAQIKKNGAKKVALQMPEGLLMYGCSIVDIIERFSSSNLTGEDRVECIIMGDVTYGACCIDDYTARALGCDMMVHYGHSCLVPVDTTTIKTLYVFVEIAVDRAHLAASIRLNFPHCIPSPNGLIGSSKGKGPELEISIEEQLPSTITESMNIEKKITKLAVVGTIQFVAAVQGLKADLEIELTDDDIKSTEERLLIGDGSDETLNSRIIPKVKPTFEVTVPQVKPLSPGEILGCTAPRLAKDIDALIYVGDGRFHLESVMIANPLIPAFRYDPYTKKLTRELYEHDEMRLLRGKAVRQAKESLNVKKLKGEKGEIWAVVLGTLGRQGNVRVLKSVTRHLNPTSSNSLTSTTSSHTTPFMPLLLSELSPSKLSLFTGISTFVQTSCPRLSIDWGYAFTKPLLSTYEASVALGVKGARGWGGMGLPAVLVGTEQKLQEQEKEEEEEKEDYPMDFYADNSLGEWTPRAGMGIKRTGGEKGRPIPKSKRTAAAVPIAIVV